MEETKINRGDYKRIVSLKYIKSDSVKFIRDYDLQLAKYITRGIQTNTFNLDEIKKEEFEFIELLLQQLKERNEEIRRIKSEIAQEFYEINNLKNEDLDLNLDSKDDNDIQPLLDRREKKEISEQNHSKMKEGMETEFISFNIKISFLLAKSCNVGYTFNLDEGLQFNKIEDNNENFSDSEMWRTKGTEKLIILNELGLIDFLRQKHPDLSNNKLAKVLGAITGENHLQPAVNSMLGEQKFSDRKSPYYSKKTAPKIKDQLIQWGFNISADNHS